MVQFVHNISFRFTSGVHLANGEEISPDVLLYLASGPEPFQCFHWKVEANKKVQKQPDGLTVSAPKQPAKILAFILARQSWSISPEVMTDELEAIGKGLFMNTVPEGSATPVGGNQATWVVKNRQRTEVILMSILRHEVRPKVWRPLVTRISFWLPSSFDHHPRASSTAWHSEVASVRIS